MFYCAWIYNHKKSPDYSVLKKDKKTCFMTPAEKSRGLPWSWDIDSVVIVLPIYQMRKDYLTEGTQWYCAVENAHFVQQDFCAGAGECPPLLLQGVSQSDLRPKAAGCRQVCPGLPVHTDRSVRTGGNLHGHGSIPILAPGGWLLHGACHMGCQTQRRKGGHFWKRHVDATNEISSILDYTLKYFLHQYMFIPLAPSNTKSILVLRSEMIRWIN